MCKCFNSGLQGPFSNGSHVGVKFNPPKVGWAWHTNEKVAICKSEICILFSLIIYVYLNC